MKKDILEGYKNMDKDEKWEVASIALITLMLIGTIGIIGMFYVADFYGERARRAEAKVLELQRKCDSLKDVCNKYHWQIKYLEDGISKKNK